MKNKWLIIVIGLALLLFFAPAGCASISTSAQTPKQPIEIISVLDTTTMINPGGPTIKITLKNVSNQPVVSLSITLEEGGPRSFIFDFDITPSNPLSPGESISSERLLIGGGFGGEPPYGNFPYFLTISGTMQSGATFNFIWEPPNKPDVFALYVSKVNHQSTSVEIMYYATGRKVTVSRDDPDITEILRLLSISTTKQVTSKTATMVENGKTVTAQRTIPYPMGFILTFGIKDGSKVKFNVTSDNIWFETDDNIYRASVDSEFFPFLENMAPSSTSALISKERAIEIASKTLNPSIVQRANIKAELHVWYWEVIFDNLNAVASELMPFPLKGPLPPPPGQPTVEPYPGIWQTVIMTVDAQTGDLKSAGARQAPKPGPYMSQEQAVEIARAMIQDLKVPDWTWIDRAKVEAYLVGDMWTILFWEEGSTVNRIKASVGAVDGSPKGASRG